MTTGRNTNDEWKSARIAWESEPLASYAHIAQKLGVSKALVGKRAKKEGWQKRLDSATVNERAHFQADSKFKFVAGDNTLQALGVDGRPAQKWDPTDLRFVPSDVPEAEARAVAEASVIDRRAEVLARHRSEANAVRGQIYAAIKSPDIDIAKKAKIVAESMKIVQEIERRSWGLDSDEKGSKPTVQIVVNRRAGPMRR